MARRFKISALKKVNLFSNRYAYWFLGLHVFGLLGFLAVSLVPTAFDMTLQATPFVLTLYLPFLGLQLVWLTATNKWGHFLRWFVTRWAEFKDRFGRITSNVHLAARRVGTPDQSGFLLTMEPVSLSSGITPRKITYQDDRHVMMIAGSRAGKGRDFIIPNLSTWQGSVIAYDPSGELVRETAQYRKEVLG